MSGVASLSAPKGGVAVAVIVGAAEDDDDIAVLGQVIGAAAEAQVKARLLACGLLVRKAGAADAEIHGLDAVFRSHAAVIAQFLVFNADALGNAVAEEGDFFALQIHIVPLLLYQDLIEFR